MICGPQKGTFLFAGLYLQIADLSIERAVHPNLLNPVIMQYVILM